MAITEHRLIVELPLRGGFETCRRLKRIRHLAHIPVIFMTGLSDTEHIVKGLEAGGVDYLTKPADIVRWLAKAAKGEPEPHVWSNGHSGLELTYVGRPGNDEHLLRLARAASEDAAALLRQRFTLTIRETEVLLWVARGKSNKDISVVLNISPRTVNKHLEQVFQKLGVENRASAAAITIQLLHRYGSGGVS